MDQSLLAALSLLGAQGLHRIPVFADDQLVKVVTQSALARFLFQHVSSWSSLVVNDTVFSTGLGLKPVVVMSMVSDAQHKLQWEGGMHARPWY